MTINRFTWNKLTKNDKLSLLERSELNITKILPAVQEIIHKVSKEGDKALKYYNTLFDKAPQNMDLLVKEKEFFDGEQLLSDKIKKSLEYSIANIKKFHIQQKPEKMSFIEIAPGVLGGEKASPIDSVGLYVPRGRGSFPSMLYMLAVPAKIAGVKKVCVVTPPDQNGHIDPACLYAAKLCGVTEIYKMGGAQSIAALAFGTESIPKVNKICGPGSMYVAAAKRLLYGKVDVGLPAGPSESMILADGTADPEKIALDLLIEAEHGSDSSALLVTNSPKLADIVEAIIKENAENLNEPRKTFVKNVMAGYGGIILCESIEQGAQIVNEYAPEHLSVQTLDPFETLSLINNSGEILLGEHCPFSIANYSVGPNAVLPTGGNAKTFSAVSVRDFIKYSSVIYTSHKGLKKLKDPVTTLCDYEGFETHANALKLRKDL